MLSLFARADVSGYRGSVTPPVGNAYYPGIYTKVMPFMIGNNTYFPTGNYNNNDSTSVWGQLANAAWFRGLLWPVGWGSCETSSGVYDYTELQRVMDMVGDPSYAGNIYTVSGKASAQNKKVLILLDTKTFDSDAATVDHLIPGYLQATGTAYGNGMVRYHRLLPFETVNAQTGASVQGYHLRWQDFRSNLSGNDRAGQPIYTMRTAFMNFLTDLHNTFKDHPAFAGIVMTEPIPVASNITNVTGTTGGEYNRDQFFDGRLQWLKDLKNIFTAHPIIEMPTFDNSYMQDMTNENAPDGCIVNSLGIGGPNFHNGTNLQSIINAKDFAADKVIICNQIQGLDQDSKTGYFTRSNTASNPAPNDVFNFPSAPNTVIENPNFNASNQLISQDVPDFDFMLDKAIWLKTNILIYQYDIGNQTSRATTGGVRGNRYNWVDFSADMNGTKGTNYISPNTGGPIKNDPNGGMVTTLPQFWV